MIGALIILWIVIGITNLGKINTVAMGALFILTIIMCKVIFFSDASGVKVSGDSMSFGAAVELAVAMPLSWLPLISDYTKEAKEPIKATFVSTIVYGIVSCWMYIIGMGAAIFTGESDVAQIMVKAGLGIVGLLIVVFSTVTTTFLDAYSAGISSETIFSKSAGKNVDITGEVKNTAVFFTAKKSSVISIIVTVIGTVAAILFPMDDITDFMYLIGSVFAPMIAIQIADYFILKSDKSSKKADITNAVIWVIGFILYRYLMTVDIPVGNTLPDMAVTIVIAVVAGKIINGGHTAK